MTASRLRHSPQQGISTKHEIILYWSAEDHVFVAEVPELPGCTVRRKKPH